MPVDKRPIAFRTSFDQVAGDYDVIRPGYPPALIDDIVTLAALPPRARILEGRAALRFSAPRRPPR